jgi:hypothetical protein
MSSEMVKYEIVLCCRLGERRLTWLMLMWMWVGCCRLVQAAVGALVVERERKS